MTPPPLPEVIIEEAIKRFRKEFTHTGIGSLKYVNSDVPEVYIKFLSSELSTAITKTREGVVEEIRNMTPNLVVPFPEPPYRKDFIEVDNLIKNLTNKS